MARLKHWLLTRARRWPPNNASLGAPVSSRLRLDGAKFWIRWNSINRLMMPLSIVGRCWSFFADVGRQDSIEVPRPALTHGITALGVDMRVEPDSQVAQQYAVVQRLIASRQQTDDLPQINREVLGVGSQQGDKALLDAGAVALTHQFAQASSQVFRRLPRVRGIQAGHQIKRQTRRILGMPLGRHEAFHIGIGRCISARGEAQAAPEYRQGTRVTLMQTLQVRDKALRVFAHARASLSAMEGMFSGGRNGLNNASRRGYSLASARKALGERPKPSRTACQAAWAAASMVCCHWASALSSSASSPLPSKAITWPRERSAVAKYKAAAGPLSNRLRALA